MQLRKVVLGLGMLAMLASCGAKQITKAEAIKIAREHCDASNQVYKSGHGKAVTEVRYSDNVPEELRTQKGNIEEGDITRPEQFSVLRLYSKDIDEMDEEIYTFKADGNKLEITLFLKSNDDPEARDSMVRTQVLKVDEIGYFLEIVDETKIATIASSGVTYEFNVKTIYTYTWNK